MDSSYKPISKTLIFSHLPKNTHKAFEKMAGQNWLKEDGWYLAGGTALSLQCDHRVSVDLDFFTTSVDFDIDRIISFLSPLGWITTLSEKGTLYGELEGAKISFISYPYFNPKKSFISHKAISVMDASDIAVMKIIAISQRGKKRDFFDLYWYVINCESLLGILQRVESQYPNIKHSYHHIIKSLTYFEEAEDDPDPQIFFEATWDQIKQYFKSIITDVANKLLK